jgi:hypothetical protein
VPVIVIVACNQNEDESLGFLSIPAVEYRQVKMPVFSVKVNNHTVLSSPTPSLTYHDWFNFFL